MILLHISCYKRIRRSFYLYTQSREFLLGCYQMYLVRNSSNKQHQSERVFALVRIPASAVTDDTTNENVKHCTALVKVEMLLNNTTSGLDSQYKHTKN